MTENSDGFGLELPLGTAECVVFIGWRLQREVGLALAGESQDIRWRCKDKEAKRHVALRNSSDLVPLVCTEEISRKEEAQMGACPHTLW